MKQLIGIPYSTLKENERAYKIMLLRDLHDYTFKNIAQQYGISTTRANQIYNRIKYKQIYLYINHLVIINGYEDKSALRETYLEVYRYYQDHRFAAAYYEKEYKEILSAYRDGEPGLPEQFIEKLPPFRKKIDEETIGLVIHLREAEKKTFIEIANELQMTPQKAGRTYEMYYHNKVMFCLNKIETAIGEDVRDYYLQDSKYTKEKYEMMLLDYPELFSEAQQSDREKGLQENEQTLHIYAATPIKDLKRAANYADNHENISLY